MIKLLIVYEQRIAIAALAINIRPVSPILLITSGEMLVAQRVIIMARCMEYYTECDESSPSLKLYSVMGRP